MGYSELAMSVVLTAIQDAIRPSRASYTPSCSDCPRRRRLGGESCAAIRTCEEKKERLTDDIEQFFASDWYQFLLGDVEEKWLWRKVRTALKKI